VRFHPDAMTGSVNEIVGPSGLGQYRASRSIHRLAACADDSGNNTGFLCAAKVLPCSGDVNWRFSDVNAARNVTAVPAHRATEVAQHDVASFYHATSRVMVGACSIVAGGHNRKIHHIVTFGNESRGDIGRHLRLGSTNERNLAALQLGSNPIGGRTGCGECRNLGLVLVNA
jgi:hypothetical protein